MQEAREPLQEEMLLVLLAGGLLPVLLEPCEFRHRRDGVGFPGGIETGISEIDKLSYITSRRGRLPGRD